MLRLCASRQRVTWKLVDARAKPWHDDGVRYGYLDSVSRRDISDPDVTSIS